MARTIISFLNKDYDMIKQTRNNKRRSRKREREKIDNKCAL